MTHLAWIAVDSFRPVDSHRDVIVDFAVTITTETLALVTFEQSAILDPGTNPLLLRNSAPGSDQDRFASTGTWSDIAARGVSISSFDRKAAGSLAQSGITAAAPALAICSQIERALIAEYAPNLSAILSQEAADVTSFRLLASLFLPGAAQVDPSPNVGRADHRVQSRLNDLVNTVNAIKSLKGVAAA